jgi:putative Mg2+ transporter-C (MgtC) family protein
VLAVVTLSAARWLDRAMPQKNFTEISVRSRRETPLDEAELRAVLAEYDLTGLRLNHCLAGGGTVFELAGAFSGKGVLRLNEVACRLRGDPRVVEFDILPRKD